MGIEINKRTLFVYPRCYSLDVKNTIVSLRLFDLKTLTQLPFKSKQDAIKFCRKYNETECIDEINGITHKRGKSRLYIGTNAETKKHSVINMTNCIVNELSSDKLIEYVSLKAIVNLEVAPNNKIRIKWLIEQAPKGFEEHIADRYEEFQQGLRLIGRNQDFKYKIIGKYAILTESCSKFRQVVIPSFVESISEFAFASETDEIMIGKGLKFIGNYGVENHVKLSLSEDNTLEYVCARGKVNICNNR